MLTIISIFGRIYRQVANRKSDRRTVNPLSPADTRHKPKNIRFRIASIIRQTVKPPPTFPDRYFPALTGFVWRSS